MITDAGIDQSALSGAACEPGDLDALIQQCRVEPVDYFFDYRCPGASTAAQARIRELFNNSGIYSCSAFGRDLMRCVAPRAVECAAADGGTARDLIAQRIVSECNASVGGPRINLLCDDACNEAHTACFSACRACTFESCALCSFNCGKQFVACRSRCPPP